MRSLNIVAALACSALIASLGLQSAQARPASSELNSVGAAGVSLTNIDDQLADPAYASFAQQRVDWSSANCGPTTIADLAGYEIDAALVECAQVIAPMDWHNPSGPTIKVGIARYKQDASDLANHTRPLMLSNPGGPGGSGAIYGLRAPIIARSTSHIAVGIDPRGLGDSTGLDCPEVTIPDGFDAMDPRRRTAEEARLTQQLQDEIIRACATTNPLARFINSEQTARDFNLVRQLLGYDTTDYYGVSYGSWLGAVFAKMFPRNMGRVILDANTQWEGERLQDTFRMMPQSFQAAYDNLLLPYLARRHAALGLGSSPGEVDRTIETLRAAFGAGTFSTKLTVNHFDGITSFGLYSSSGFDSTGNLLADLNRALHDGTAPELGDALAGLLTQPVLDRRGGNVHYAIRCADSGPDPASNSFAEGRATAQNLPLRGHSAQIADCAAWPFPAAVTSDIMKRPLPRTLVVHNEGDPATSYRGAYTNMLRARGDVRFVMVDDGPGHGGLQFSNKCLQDIWKPFINDGKLPTQNITCQAGPIGNDSKVYEFGKPGTAPSTVPRPYLYVMRNVVEPPVDQAATDALGSGSVELAEVDASNTALAQRVIVKTQRLNAALTASGGHFPR